MSWAAGTHFAPTARPNERWRQLSLDKLTAATGHPIALLDHFFTQGQLELHEVTVDGRRVGTLVLFFSRGKRAAG